MKNPPNINAENLPLPSGHRWVDIANEEPNPAARFWWAGEWVTIDDADHDWRFAWSYCIPVPATPELTDPATRPGRARPATPEPRPDFAGHASRLDLIVTEIAELGHAFGATGNDRVADRLAQLAFELSEEVIVASGFARLEAGQ